MIIFITGASRGIGAETKKYFEKYNHTVIAPTRKELDLSSSQSVQNYLQNNNFDSVDVLINNAGINDLNLIENISEDELQNTLQVDLLAIFNLCKHFIPIFKQKKMGRIVNIGSVWTHKSKPMRGSYTIAKEGVWGLTKMIAVENSEHNILCNMVSPGFIETELTIKNNSDEQIQSLLKNVPAKRLGQPLEVAKLIYFLTVENTFISGQNIFIDGGYTINS